MSALIEIPVSRVEIITPISILGAGVIRDKTISLVKHPKIASMSYTQLGLIVRCKNGAESFIPASNIGVAHAQEDDDERAKQAG